MSARVESCSDFHAGSWIGAAVDPPVMRTMSGGLPRLVIAAPFSCTA
jgi:hypothetical protein